MIDVRLYDLRHAFASIPQPSGMSLPTIGTNVTTAGISQTPLPMAAVAAEDIGRTGRLHHRHFLPSFLLVLIPAPILARHQRHR
jgi:hypothetical protein